MASPTWNRASITSDTANSIAVVMMATCFAARASRQKTKSGMSPRSGMTTRSVRMLSKLIAG